MFIFTYRLKLYIYISSGEPTTPLPVCLLTFSVFFSMVVSSSFESFVGRTLLEFGTHSFVGNFFRAGSPGV